MVLIRCQPWQLSFGVDGETVLTELESFIPNTWKELPISGYSNDYNGEKTVR